MAQCPVPRNGSVGRLWLDSNVGTLSELMYQGRCWEMDELLKIGFLHIGEWGKNADGLEYRLHRFKNGRPALYSFVIDDQVMYVGKTKRTLNERMYNYLRGSGTQRTNIRVREKIEAALDKGAQVQIFGFVDENPQRVGPFELNLPAALEDDILDQLNPPWNGGASRVPLQSPPDHRANATEPDEGSLRTASRITQPAPSFDESSSFRVQIGQTYFRQGFFNVPVSHSSLFGRHGNGVTIVAPSTGLEKTGKINRSVNPNNTPRIMGGAKLRDWLQANVSLNGFIKVKVQNAGSISIEAATTL